MFPPPEVRDFTNEDLTWRARKTDAFSVALFIDIGEFLDYVHLRYVHGLEFAFDPQKVSWLDDYHIEYE